MALMKRNWEAALTDCAVLEREVELALADSQPQRAKEGLHELANIVQRWSSRLVALRKVLLERGYTVAIPDIDDRVAELRAFAEYGRERFRQVRAMEGV